ncbi:MAG: lipoyl synthase [Armatimonadetes bacterium]|nr:lipoyl synthase [Armatimonadota bacterium]
MPEQSPPRPAGRLPDWLKVKMGKARLSESTRRLVQDARLHTVCQSAKCPNIGECFGAGTATFLLMGDRCTRNCGFCAVRAGPPEPLDEHEPRRVAETVAEMALDYAVLTSVTRDDLPDGGAGHFAATVCAIKAARPEAQVEVLVPDFQGDETPIRTVLEAAPDVFNHNLETVRRLQAQVRPQAGYETSLGVLRAAHRLAPAIPTKSGLMVGLGETDEEVAEALRDLAEVGVSIVTIGQYLQPSPTHLPVARFVHPDLFARYGQVGESLGLKHVIAGPFVRSSYHAEEAARTLRARTES